MMKAKHLLALSLAVVLVLGLLAGCGGNTESTQPSTAAATKPTTEPAAEPTTEPTTAPTTEPETEPATEPVEEIVDLFLQEPDGFFTDFSTGYLRAPNYPEDLSYICVIPTERNDTILEMDAAQYEASMKLILAVSGQEAEVSVDSLEPVEVDGYPAIRCVADMTMNDVSLHITEYQIVADQNYSISFADATADGVWAEAFEASAATIDLLKEGEYGNVDFSGMTQYNLECGLSLYAWDEFEEFAMEGVDGYLESYDILFYAVRDSKEDLLSAGYSSLNLDQYAKLVSDAYGIDEFTTDNLGNLYSLYTEETEDGNLFYFFTVKRGEDAYWTCYFLCYEENMPYFLSSMSMWASSITEN